MSVIYSKPKKGARASVTVGKTPAKAGEKAGAKEKKNGK